MAHKKAAMRAAFLFVEMSGIEPESEEVDE